MTYVDHATDFCQRLTDLDDRFIQAERRYIARTLRGFEPNDLEWPEGRDIDALSDERWNLEERAIRSGDLKAIERVRRRRERDGIDVG